MYLVTLNADRDHLLHPLRLMFRRTVAPIALLLILQLMLPGGSGLCAERANSDARSAWPETHHSAGHVPADPPASHHDTGECALVGACAGVGACLASECLLATGGMGGAAIPADPVHIPAAVARAPEPPPPRG